MSDAPQNTAAWHENRLGKVTASRVFDIMPGKRGGYLAPRKKYMLELLAERITGVELDNFVSKAMQWGTDTESLARSAYEAWTGSIVTEVGFIEHPTIPSFGSSPDGLIGEDGGLELKCPTQTTHLEVMSTGAINPRYIYQMQTGMMCTGREYWDYVDYDPRMPEFAMYYCVRVKAVPLMFQQIEHEVRLFITELDAMEAKIRSKA